MNSLTFLGSPACLIVTLVGLIIIYLTDSAVSVDEIYMFDYCGSAARIRVGKSLILHLTRPESLPPLRADGGVLFHCGLTISAKDNTNRLLLHILRLHIDLNHTDRLHVYEVAGRTFHRLSPGPGLFGKYGDVVQISSDGITDYKTHGDTFYLDYEGLPTQEFGGFSILFTAFHEVSTLTGSCFGTFFGCDTAHICIDPTLKCDGHRNCGEYDNTDEISCSMGLPAGSEGTHEDSTITIALAVGIVATLTFLLVSLAIFLVTRLRRRHMASSRRLSRTTSGDSLPEQQTRQSELNLSSLYAPPSYEDVMLTSTSNLNLERPPPYDSLASLHIEEIPIGTRRTHRQRDQQDESSFCSPPSRSANDIHTLSNMAANKDGGTTVSVPGNINILNELSEPEARAIETINENNTSES